jgi:RimJ/RimL family protein N-acetyltransferase
LSDVTTIVTNRLRLTPLVVGDAVEMIDVLAHPAAIYDFTGGEPATLEELHDRYRSLVGGSGRDSERWLNWIVRRRGDGAAIGTVQATVMNPDDHPVGFVAWTIGVAWQRQGYATEATIALVEWLVAHDVSSIVAHIHPDHTASANVATRAGLLPTSEMVDGEVVWRLPQPSDQSV